jgi:protein-S-isoprenylcysteine O-methyltransferase Ste14
MTETADVERAERLSRRRARIFAVQAIIFIGWQGQFFSRAIAEPMRTVDTIKISAWFVWVLILLLLLATGGNLWRGRKVRALLNDEFTRRNRTQAYVAGFWAAAIAAIGLYLIDLFDVVTAREAIHAILSAAIASALITFAARERRSLREA